jgi:hypothetical protein
VHQGRDLAAARGSERVAERNRAALGVQLGRRDLTRANARARRRTSAPRKEGLGAHTGDWVHTRGTGCTHEGLGAHTKD